MKTNLVECVYISYDILPSSDNDFFKNFNIKKNIENKKHL